MNHEYLVCLDRHELHNLCTPFIFLNVLLSFNQNPLGYLEAIFYFTSESTYYGCRLTVGKYITSGI